jgi:hypothetical protein
MPPRTAVGSALEAEPAALLGGDFLTAEGAEQLVEGCSRVERAEPLRGGCLKVDGLIPPQGGCLEAERPVLSQGDSLETEYPVPLLGGRYQAATAAPGCEMQLAELLRSNREEGQEVVHIRRLSADPAGNLSPDARQAEESHFLARRPTSCPWCCPADERAEIKLSLLSTRSFHSPHSSISGLCRGITS